jgi:GNAT superfamily N-acetyltransferase
MEILERLPTPREYVGLRERVGWSSPSMEDCERALVGSLAAVCVVDEGEAVGMGRLVGDGGMCCFAVDVVVDPRVQGEGLGRAIMERLEAVAAERRYAMRLDLVAAPNVVPFYRRLGYEELPSDLMRKQL